MRQIVPLALLAALALQGCLAKTAIDVAAAPVKVAGKAVDLATTSQSEADEKRGRELRKREERLGKLERRYRDQREDCEGGDRKACDKARETYEEIERLRPTIPYEPED
ncbi:hypothetical protein [Citromicrobium bathyomarinum]|uniref:hypothetical protein n=1 Tax=Citromicrobium bathyomarinum TaxID=72174 RepID=UPI00315B051E